MKWFQRGYENKNCSEKVSEEGAKQHKKASYAQARPAEQTPENLHRRSADLSPGQQVVGHVLAGQFFQTAQRGQGRINPSGRYFYFCTGFSAHRGLVHDVAAQLFDNLSDLFVVDAAQSRAQPAQVPLDSLLRIA